MDIWQSVQVTNEDHPRFNTAGTVQQRNPAAPDEVGVRFDADSVLEVVQVADLKSL